MVHFPRVWQRCPFFYHQDKTKAVRLLRTEHKMRGFVEIQSEVMDDHSIEGLRPCACLQEAVCMLNSLQCGGRVPEQLQQQSVHPELQLHAMRGFLLRAGLPLEELDHLNAIHVAGTKGKGSTCAFTETILRSYGFRTGFYSSPHLVHVRERIRINGQPISKELFAKYFWQVYEKLDATKFAHGDTMPGYFVFLTILAFHVFLQEKVDLAVIEVGIGGAYDCTNVIRKPWVCGVSSLGIDHTDILGDTIEEIAWQKAGIFKPGVPAFTVKQPKGSMTVLQDRAKEMECPLFVCPDLKRYQVPSGLLHLGLEGQHQHFNASLALQLCSGWLQRRYLRENHLPVAEPMPLSQAPTFQLSPFMVKGLEDTEWPGRTQTLRHGPVTYFLDGAHTTNSMLACVRWFTKATALRERAAGGPVVRVLLFNATGERDCAALLRPLAPYPFDFAVFCPNMTETVVPSSADQHNPSVTVEKMLTRCLDNQRSWQILTEGEEMLRARRLRVPLMASSVKRKDTLVFPCILSALQWISQGKDPVLASLGKDFIPVHPSITARARPLREAACIHILVTGSLHLVGGVLKHLDSSLET